MRGFPAFSVNCFGDALRGLDDNRLEVLAAAYAAGSAASAGTVVFVNPAGKAHQVFACAPDSDDAQVFFPYFSWKYLTVS